VFKPSVSSVSLKIGSATSAGETVHLLARSSSGKVDEETVTLSPALQTVVLSGNKKIKKVILSLPAGSDACYFVVDDITFTP
jgi:hypothetical protein